MWNEVAETKHKAKLQDEILRQQEEAERLRQEEERRKQQEAEQAQRELGNNALSGVCLLFRGCSR
jgi:hypothetical protein